MLEYYTLLKKGCILQSKGAHFEKFHHRAMGGSEITFNLCSNASCGLAWPLHFKFASFTYVLIGSTIACSWPAQEISVGYQKFNGENQ